jgi:glycosyltransferase involved in cell wall biosynthesis
MKPNATCIMPTHNRRAFSPRAIEYFLRQDYHNKELIIVDHGPDPIEDLIPADPRICYRRCDDQIPLGAKRNLACQEARGEIITNGTRSHRNGPNEFVWNSVE